MMKITPESDQMYSDTSFMRQMYTHIFTMFQIYILTHTQAPPSKPIKVC